MWSNTHNVFPWWSVSWRLGSMFPQQQKWGDCMFPDGVVWRYFVCYFSTLVIYNTVAHIVGRSASSHSHAWICTILTGLSVLSAMSLASLSSQASKSGHVPHQKYCFVPNPPRNIWGKSHTFCDELSLNLDCWPCVTTWDVVVEWAQRSFLETTYSTTNYISNRISNPHTPGGLS